MTDWNDKDLRLLAAIAYGEASTANDTNEIGGIAFAVANRCRAWGGKSVSELRAIESSYAYAWDGSNQRFNKLMSAHDDNLETDLGMKLAVHWARKALANEGPDPSNGAFWWDGRDFKTNYANHRKVLDGFKWGRLFPQHLWIAGEQVLGHQAMANRQSKNRPDCRWRRARALRRDLGFNCRPRQHDFLDTQSRLPTSDGSKAIPMKGTRILMTALAVASSNASSQSQHYDAFYSDQPGAVFNTPIAHRGDPKKPGAHAVFSYPGQNGYFSELGTTLGGKPLKIQIWQDRIVVNGKSLRFSHAIAFPREQASYIFPDSSEVFAAATAASHGPVLCVSGHGSASGEASSRYQQIFLVIKPLASKPTVLQLPGLLSSCRAVVMTRDGKLAYPNNSYLYDDANESRIGLLLTYYTFDGRRFAATGNALRLKFAGPDNPFQFSPLHDIESAEPVAASRPPKLPLQPPA